MSAIGVGSTRSCTPGTRAFLHRLSGAVALVEEAALEDVKTRLLGQISVVLSRATGRAIRRRRTLIEDQAPGCTLLWLSSSWVLKGPSACATAPWMMTSSAGQ